MEHMVSGNELLLVGSIPLDTPERGLCVVWRAARPLSVRHARWRSSVRERHWISRVHYQVLAAHPELEVVQHPAPDHNGVERLLPRDRASSGS